MAHKLAEEPPMPSGHSVRRSFAVAVFLSALWAGSAFASGPVELVSRADPASPPQAVGAAYEASVSADGRYVAFLSTSPNMVPGQNDGNHGPDVFLWDRDNQTVTLVSRSSAAPSRTGSAASISPRISADGRWVVFLSQATDLIPGQIDGWGINSTTDVFLWDRTTGAIVLVSRSAASAVTAGNGDALVPSPSLSEDGAFVTFQSSATDLVSGQTDTNSFPDVFLYDRAAGTLALVSHASGAPATAGNSASGAPVISADGQSVAYVSQSTDLVAGQTDINSMNDIFLYDRTTGTSVLVSHASGSATTAGNGFCATPRLSADGRWTAYTCNASDLVAGQIGGNISNVFLYDRTTNASILVSHASGSATSGGNDLSGEPSISADGAYVAYSSLAGDLVAGQTEAGAASDIFLFDRLAGTSVLVSGASGSTMATANAASVGPVLSSDGSRLAFVSAATDLLSNQSDANGVSDILLYTRSGGSLDLVSRKGPLISLSGPAKPMLPAIAGNGASTGPALSSTGNYVAFTSLASDLTPASDTNKDTDVFLYPGPGMDTLAVSFSPAVSSATSDSFSAAGGSSLSADGRAVAFFSWGGNLIAGMTDINGEESGDIYLRDRVAGTTALVSRSTAVATTTGNRHSQLPALSADGAWVAFESYASDIVSGVDPGPPFGDPDVFLYDRAAGTNILVSHAPGLPTQSAEGMSNQAVISADGSWIVFSNLAGNVVSGLTDTNSAQDLFLYSRASNESVLVSRNSSSPTATGNGPSELPSLSADGRYVAFLSRASNLVAGQTMNNSDYNVFLFDRVSGTTTLVSHASSSLTTTGNGGEPSAQFIYRPVISADGAWVAFASRATDLVAGQTDTNSGDDVFLWERATGTITLVSHASASITTAGNEASDSPSLSADGRYIAFHSDASDLAPGQVDTNLAHDVFVYDRVTGTTALVSHAAGSTTEAAAGLSFQPVVSANGAAIAFHSNAADLLAGQVDRPGTTDVFLYDRLSGATRLLSHTGGSVSAAANSGSGSPQISADGETVSFNSFASDLVADDYNLQTDVFVHGRAGLDYHTLTPCRLFDTRTPQDGPALTSGVTELFVLTGACGVPATAKAVALNVTAVQATGSGNLSLFPGDFLLLPVASTVNFQASGTIRANNAIIPLAGDGTGTVLVRPFVAGGGAVHLILDVAGYFTE
jgi:Tol biopolymer transport system component